jgi:hypothetical protein
VCGSLDFGAPHWIIDDKEEHFLDFKDIFTKLAGFLFYFIIEMLDFWTQCWVITCMNLKAYLEVTCPYNLGMSGTAYFQIVEIEGQSNNDSII